jgi:hypothetical protein
LLIWVEASPKITVNLLPLISDCLQLWIRTNNETRWERDSIAFEGLGRCDFKQQHGGSGDDYNWKAR